MTGTGTAVGVAIGAARQVVLDQVTLLKLVPVTVAPDRFASVRSALFRLAPDRLAPLRLALERSAPARWALASSGFRVDPHPAERLNRGRVNGVELPGGAQRDGMEPT